MGTFWGKVVLAGIGAAAGWHVLGPQGRRSVVEFLEQLAIGLEQQRQQRAQVAPSLAVQPPVVQPPLTAPHLRSHRPSSL